MKDSEFLRILAGIMFDCPVKDVEKTIAKNRSIPDYLSTNEFSENLRFVFRITKRIVAFRWQNFFDTCHEKMLHSHQEYLTCVIFACIREQKCHYNEFDSFISVCAVLKVLNDDTFQKTRINFSILNPDIIWVFFFNWLEKSMSRRGGLQNFVKYIRNHRYLKWKGNDSSISPEDNSIIFNGMNLEELIEEEIRRDKVVAKVIDVDKAVSEKFSMEMAQIVLGITAVELPTIPNIQKVSCNIAAYKKKMANKPGKNRTETVETLGACSQDLHENFNLSSELKTNYATKYQDDREKHEKVIQAVIRHNHSKYSGHKNANNEIQKEADEVLEHLNENIKSLMKLLD